MKKFFATCRDYLMGFLGVITLFVITSLNRKEAEEEED